MKLTPWLNESDYQSQDTGKQVNERMRAMIGSLGLDHFAFTILKPPRDMPFSIEDTIRTNYPAEWMNRYSARRYFEFDPVIDLATKVIQPYFWGQGRFLREFKKPQRRVFDEAREFKISYGLAIPVRGPRGELSVFNVVSSCKRHLRQVTKNKHSRLLAAAFDTHDRVMEDKIEQNQKPKDVVELTHRERECLVWTLEGKTAGEIASILNLSVSTINHHLMTASHKSGSLNKHHAAVKALRSGLIQ